jgi:hypothetical protein
MSQAEIILAANSKLYRTVKAEGLRSADFSLQKCPNALEHR